MTVRFDETALVAALERLPRAHRVVFAAACAERLMPAYADAFSAALTWPGHFGPLVT